MDIEIDDRAPETKAGVPGDTLLHDDMMRIFKSGKMGGFIGLESGHHIDSSLGTLRMFYELGVRYMTLTWNDPVPWADTWFLPPQHNGLTKFGVEVVREMNRLGMFVDIAHVHEQTMQAVLRVTEAPVLISHGSARALGDVGRNVPDSIISQLPKNGGVLMVFFMQQYTTTAGARHADAQTAERERLVKLHPNDQPAVRAALEAWRKDHPAPKTSVTDVANVIDHIRRVASIDNIGLGSDFETRKLCFKRYPCHVTAHTPVQSVLALRREFAFAGHDFPRQHLGDFLQRDLVPAVETDGLGAHALQHIPTGRML